jgi:chromosome segregation ATPase
MVESLSYDLLSIGSQVVDMGTKSKMTDHSSQNEQQKQQPRLPSSYHTREVDQEIENATVQEVKKWKAKYESLENTHGVALEKIATLTARVNVLEKESATAKNKAELREGLLKDVIQQYKELEKEHSSSNDKLRKLKEKVAHLVVKQYRQDKNNNKAKQVGGPAKGGSPALKSTEKDDPSMDPAASFDVTEATTFDEGSEHVHHHSQDDSTSASSTAFAEGGNGISLEEYQRLESECDRLHHEFESAMAKITILEEELEEAKSSIQDTKKVHADQSHDLALLESEKARLQEELLQTKELLSKMSSNENDVISADDVRMAELRVEEARTKQMEREQDLWDVIEQYKALSEQAENTERELHLTNKVKIQRRDMVYEFRKLERSYEDAIEKVKRLEHELKHAKAEAARNKEEAKGVRKRLVGCHFHYKQSLREKDDLVHELIRSKQYASLLQTQTSEFRSQFDHVQGSLLDSKKQIDRLTQENEELHKYCEDLLTLASTSLEAVQ